MMPKVQSKTLFEMPTLECSIKVFHGDNLEILQAMPANSIDSIVTDPPYGLGKEPDAQEMLNDWVTEGHHDVKGKGFMGKEWDAFVPQPIFWRECLRVLKPGGYLLSFAGTRTQDLMALGLRIAGFEIRDMIAWVYGSGFPKSLDVSKAIDKAAGKAEERGYVQTTGGLHGGSGNTVGCFTGRQLSPIPVTLEAYQWQGWGTALKPALEPITVARKPLAGTVAENVLAHGTGALNIDGCRVGDEIVGWGGGAAGGNTWNDDNCGLAKSGDARPVAGRWPANLIHDGSEEVIKLFPSDGNDSAARFFYSPKVGKEEREFGMDSEEKRAVAGVGALRDGGRKSEPRSNVHPTVKPVDLMRYLCRLVTPLDGIVLDPFAGSGTTGIAATIEKFRAILIEREDQYSEICRARVGAAKPMGNGDLWETVASVNGKGR